jgi:putative transcriptional regulator
VKLGRTTKRDHDLALRDIDKALAGKPSSYARIELPVPATKEEIKQARLAMHATQRDFAMTVGVSVQTVKSWESGDRSPEGPATKIIRMLRQRPAVASMLAKIR